MSNIPEGYKPRMVWLHRNREYPKACDGCGTPSLSLRGYEKEGEPDKWFCSKCEGTPIYQGYVEFYQGKVISTNTEWMKGKADE